MGDEYNVTLRLKVRLGADPTAVMRQWMDVESLPEHMGGMRVEWGFEESAKSGIRPDSLDGICKILLAFHQGECRRIKDRKRFEVYSSKFKATYSWMVILHEAFSVMAPFLDEGSCMSIRSGGRCERYKVLLNDMGESEMWEKHG